MTDAAQKPRSICAHAIEIALAEIAADRGAQPDDLSVCVLRAIEGAVLEGYRLGALHTADEHERPTRPDPLPAGLWCDDEATPTYDYVTRVERRK